MNTSESWPTSVITCMRTHVQARPRLSECAYLIHLACTAPVCIKTTPAHRFSDYGYAYSVSCVIIFARGHGQHSPHIKHKRLHASPLLMASGGMALASRGSEVLAPQDPSQAVSARLERHGNWLLGIS